MARLTLLMGRKPPYDVEELTDDFGLWMNAVLSSWALKVDRVLERTDPSERWRPMNIWSIVSDDLMQTVPLVLVQR